MIFQQLKLKLKLKWLISVLLKLKLILKRFWKLKLYKNKNNFRRTIWKLKLERLQILKSELVFPENFHTLVHHVHYDYEAVYLLINTLPLQSTPCNIVRAVYEADGLGNNNQLPGYDGISPAPKRFKHLSARVSSKVNTSLPGMETPQTQLLKTSPNWRKACLQSRTIHCHSGRSVVTM